MARLGGEAAFANGAFAVKGGVTHVADAPFDPDHDHRMALALAPLALKFGTITINDPQVVTKSYPGFWEDLRSAGFGVGLHE